MSLGLNMLERIGAISIILGMIGGFLSLGWFLSRFLSNALFKRPPKPLRRPIVAFIACVVLATAPIVVNSLLSHFTRLGPLNKIVDGQRHLTLTGWDRHDYSMIADFPDTVVLQAANPDVTDDTLKYLATFSELQELDLNNTQLTDEGLAVLAELPKLRDLRLARTRITDDGFRRHLLNNPSLVNLDLSGTQVASKTIRQWKAAKSDRHALH